MTYTIGRRRFLRLGAVGAGVIGTGGLSALLEACGSSSKTASSPTTAASSGSASSVAPGKYGTISFQLSWIENDEFSGEYLAATRGYYTAQGFQAVNLLAGGPNVTQDAVVASGKAFAGISSPDITAAAINQGADLVIVGAQYQKNPFAIMSLASSPIHNPQEMIGKKIGVQSTNQAVWNSFLKANHISPGKIDEVPVQFDPTPLTTHTVDGWFSFITNEPNLLKVKGFDTYTFLLNDFNYPLVSETYMVQKSALTGSNRDKLKAFLRAEIMGWHDSIADPAAGPHLAVTKYGKTLGLDQTEQTLESKAQNKLILTPDTTANGIFTITPQSIANSVHTLGLGGIKISASRLFDMSVIDEIYQETPALKTSPAPGSASTSTTS
ncbi:MAG: ABC transporter substrate-binding protein [Acidimicrobiaceae bacterium]|nr:ABC transporter substrate-binding protein [Acidimicrobiaceae bacterium]